MLKIPNIGSRTIVQAHTNTTCTGMGSAALVAAVAYPKRQPEFLVEINEVLRRRRKKKDVWKKLWCLGDSDNCVCFVFVTFTVFIYSLSCNIFCTHDQRRTHVYINIYVTVRHWDVSVTNRKSLVDPFVWLTSKITQPPSESSCLTHSFFHWLPRCFMHYVKMLCKAFVESVFLFT